MQNRRPDSRKPPLRSSILSNPDRMHVFTDQSKRLADSFKQNTHQEGSAYGHSQLRIDDHDVTAQFKVKDDDTFSKVATRDQMKATQLLAAEAEVLAENLVVATEKTSKLSSTPLWQLKMKLAGARRLWVATAAEHSKAFAAEIQARLIDFEAMQDQIEVGLEECKTDWATQKKEASEQVQKFVGFVSLEESRLEKLNVEAFDKTACEEALLSVLKENNPTYKTELKEVRSALLALKNFVARLRKTLDKSDEPRPNKSHRNSGSRSAVSKLLLTLHEVEYPADAVNLLTEFASFSPTQAVMFSGEKVANMVASLLDMRYIKQLLQGNMRAMKRSKLEFQVSSVEQKKARTDIKRTVNEHIGSGELLLAKVVSEGSAAHKAFDFEIYRFTKNFHAVGLAQYGFPEVRVTLTGEQVCIGIKHTEVQGDTMREKYNSIYGMRFSDLLEMARRHGFVADMDSTQAPLMLCIPAGYIVVDIVASDIAEGIRWSFGDDSDNSCRQLLLSRRASSLLFLKLTRW